jgi:hypothetical protein
MNIQIRHANFGVLLIWHIVFDTVKLRSVTKIEFVSWDSEIRKIDRVATPIMSITKATFSEEGDWQLRVGSFLFHSKVALNRIQSSAGINLMR